MNPKIKAKINRKTGAITIMTEGYQGASCLEATKKIREELGITAEPEKTGDYYQEEQQQQQNQST